MFLYHQPPYHYKAIKAGNNSSITRCCSCASSSTTRFMCSSSSPSSAACWGARAVEEALPRTAGPPGPRLRLLLLPPDSRSWFISKSQLATSWTFARLSEEEKGLTCCEETQKKRKLKYMHIISYAINL